MKRCVNCNALISDDYNKKCPYCAKDPDVVIDEFEHIYNIDNAGEHIDDRWPTDINFIRILTPNEIRELKGLKGDTDGRNG